MTLRQRKKAQTRDQIADAALRLFTHRGFGETTVDEIARAAEISRRTFFRYFPTKQAALFPDQDRRLKELKERLATRDGKETPLGAVRRAMMALADDYHADRARIRRRQRVVDRSPTLQAYDLEMDRDWEAAIAVSLGDRRGIPAEARRRARLGAGALMGIIRAALREWHRGREASLRALGDEAFDVLMRIRTLNHPKRGR